MYVTIQSLAGESVGNFVAAIGVMKGLLARSVLPTLNLPF
jgi:hypothetical protein